MPDAIDYLALARSLTAELNDLAEKVPYKNANLPAQDRRGFTNAGVPDEFVRELAMVITNAGPLTGAIPVDVAGMLDRRRFAAAFDLLESQLRALADNVQTTTLRLRHESGTAALAAYAVTQSLARLPQGHQLVPHLKNLRRILGRGRRRHKTPVDAPTPVAPEQQS